MLQKKSCRFILNLECEEKEETSSDWRKIHTYKWNKIESNMRHNVQSVMNGAKCMNWERKRRKRTHTPKNDVLKKHFFCSVLTSEVREAFILWFAILYCIITSTWWFFFSSIHTRIHSHIENTHTRADKQSLKFQFERLYSSSFDI